MALQIFWYIVIGVFWVGFFVLEGFDFGVGMLHSFIGRNDLEERLLLNTIGPVWDANEVWLIVGGAAIFAAFPSWYATMFSTFYLPLVLILVALMIRGVTFEFRSKSDDPRWRASWKWGMTISSALIPLLLGVALGDMLHGLAINSAHQYTGNFFQLLLPYGLWSGITTLVLSLLMGVTYLMLKTTGELRERVVRFAGGIGVAAVVVVFGFITWTHFAHSSGFLPSPIDAIGMLAAIFAAWFALSGSDGWAFLSSAVTMGAVVATFFIELYPNTMISTTSSAYNITVANAASNPYSLKVMTVVALIFTPLVLVYQAWNYHVFRARLRMPRQGIEAEGTPTAGASDKAPASPTPSA
jgi:cytochrome d ubiquinol oxidase subunit II